VGRAPSRELGPRGHRGRSELRADIRDAVTADEDGSSGRADTDGGVPVGSASVRASPVGGAAPCARRARRARGAGRDEDAQTIQSLRRQVRMALDAGRRFTEAASESIRAERSEAVNRSLVSFSDRYGAFAVRCPTHRRVLACRVAKVGGRLAP